MTGVYVHIPFCVKKCVYCDFASKTAGEEEISAYFASLWREIDAAEGKADSVFFGGGTPSFVDEKYICETLERLSKRFALSKNSEITIEANPCSASAKKLAAYYKAGINRLSLGLQSAENETLKAMGRAHTFEMFLCALDNARKAGFANINTDIIYAFPSQTQNEWERTLETVINLAIPHISAYGLKIEEGTPLCEGAAKGEITPVSDEADREMYHAAQRLLRGAGYINYEISNFAKAGFECVHNLKYWNLEDYAGFGAAAHSFIKGERRENTRDIAEYIKKPLDYAERHFINGDESEFEYIMLKMRLAAGIDPGDYERRFNKNFFDCFEKPIKRLEGAGLITVAENAVRPTDKGFDLQNTLVVELMNNL